MVPAIFEEFRAIPEQFIDAGEHVVVVGRFRARPRVAPPSTHRSSMCNDADGKITKFENYVEASAWAKAWV